MMRVMMMMMTLSVSTSMTRPSPGYTAIAHMAGGHLDRLIFYSKTSICPGGDPEWVFGLA
eukprot:6624446-Lingulodinium_polyedra.AAC.1